MRTRSYTTIRGTVALVAGRATSISGREACHKGRVGTEIIQEAMRTRQEINRHAASSEKKAEARLFSFRMAFHRRGLPTTRAAAKGFSCKVTASLTGRTAQPIADALSNEVCGMAATTAAAVSVSATPLETEERGGGAVMAMAATTSTSLRVASRVA